MTPAGRKLAELLEQPYPTDGPTPTDAYWDRIAAAVIAASGRPALREGCA